jgi:hypothetical protein
MFQFAYTPLPPLCVQGGVSRHHSGGVAPFGFSRLIACMQLPLNVSPVSASFFGLMRLGIHLVLSLACSRFSCSRTNVSREVRFFSRFSLCFSNSLLSAQLK